MIEQCGVKGCQITPAFHKPYCPVHVELCDYAAKISYEQDQRVKEQAEILKRGERGVDLGGFLVTDILNALHGGVFEQMDRLHRVLVIDFKVLKHLANAMSKAGLVSRVGVTRRGEGSLTLKKTVVQQF